MTTSTQFDIDDAANRLEQHRSPKAKSFDADLATPADRERAATKILPSLRRSNEASQAYLDLASRLIGTNPILGREFLIWASQLQDQSDDAIAIDLLKLAIEKFENQPKLKGKLLQIYLASEWTSAAGDFAGQWSSWSTVDERLAHFVLLALNRSGRESGIMNFYDRWASQLNFDGRATAIVMTSLESVGRAMDAIRVGETFVENAENAEPHIHALLGRLYD